MIVVFILQGFIFHYRILIFCFIKLLSFRKIFCKISYPLYYIPSIFYRIIQHYSKISKTNICQFFIYYIQSCFFLTYNQDICSILKGICYNCCQCLTFSCSRRPLNNFILTVCQSFYNILLTWVS